MNTTVLPRRRAALDRLQAARQAFRRQYTLEESASWVTRIHPSDKAAPNSHTFGRPGQTWREYCQAMIRTLNRTGATLRLMTRIMPHDSDPTKDIEECWVARIPESELPHVCDPADRDNCWDNGCLGPNR